MSKLPYTEGTWFGVPLRQGGFGTGVVGRANPRGVLVGYFFGPSRPVPPSLEDVAELSARDAVLVAKFGHLGLTQGKWPVLGRLREWNRTHWPMPVFGRCEEVSGRCFKVIYADDDPNQLVTEEPVAPAVAEQLPRDGLLGAGAAEILLTKALSKTS